MVPDATARVLIADADPAVRHQISKRLLEGDVFADVAADGRAALDRLRERDYSVVLLDITLPSMGVEPVLDFLSAVPAARRPVILVLAPPNAARSLDVDLVQIVLRKPCNLKQLSEIVSSCFHAATAGSSGSAIPVSADKARIPIV